MELIKAELAGLSQQSSRASQAMLKPKSGTTKSMRNGNCRIDNRAGTKIEKKVAKSRQYSKIK